MLLLGVREENDWLASTFNLTYPASWDKICRAVSRSCDYLDETVVLVDNVAADIDSKDDILNHTEASNMTIRGMSTIIKIPLMITFLQSDPDSQCSGGMHDRRI